MKMFYLSNLISGRTLKKIGLALCLMSVALNVYGSTKLNGKKVELKNVTREISGLNRSLNHEGQQKNSLEHELKKLEVNIGSLAKAMVNTEDKLSQEQKTLNSLHAQQAIYQADLNQQKILLGQQVRAAYMLGQHHYLKMLLNQQNPALASRIIKYYGYVNEARVKIIEDINATLALIQKNQAAITQHTDALTALEKKQRADKASLEENFERRSNVLTQLNLTINTQTARLHELLSNQKALAQVVQSVAAKEAVLARKSVVAVKPLRGRFPLPAAGRISIHFHEQILNSGLRYNGIFISAPIGNNVHAIYAGKVVFANWLRGVGLLIIIDHGHGFMSLYGHNHSLYKRVGDTVTTGEVIASIGNSGGEKNSGLYFQLRDNGKVLNPEQWCRVSTW